MHQKNNSNNIKINNTKDLALVLDFWIENEELRHEYEEKYYESEKDFNQKKCMQKMEDMMIEVIDRKGKTPMLIDN